MFSNSSKYALKAVLYLAINSDFDNKIAVKDIAQPINVPQAYIAKLLQKLSREDIISSTRGPKGGFYLNATDKKKSIMDIINAIDGEGKLESCLLSLENCNAERPCPLHQLAYPLKTKMIMNFNKKTIEELATNIQEGHTALPL